MRPPSLTSRPFGSQDSSPIPGGQKLAARTTSEIGDSAESIRVLLRKHLPHGTKAEVAKVAGLGPDQVSRQLSGSEGIQARTIMAAFPFLPESVAGALLAILCGGTPDFDEQTALIIRFRDGQLFLPGAK